MTPLEQFDDATKAVTSERGAVYGHPADDFARVNQMEQAIKGCPDPLIRHVLYMICVKVSRLASTPSHIDSLIDIAGYARTGAMVLERQKP